jgi:hypothetical protein
MRRIVYFSISLLFISAIIDPIGSFGLRYLSGGVAAGALVLMAAFGQIRAPARDVRFALAIWLIFVMPEFAFFRYSLHAGDAHFSDTADIVTSFLYLTTFLYFDAQALAFGHRLFIASLRLLSILSIVVAPLTLTGIAAKFTDALILHNVAILGLRQYGAVNFPYIYFVASPMLIYLGAYELSLHWRTMKFSSHSIWALIAIAALLLSGTRAHQLIAILLIPATLVSERGLTRSIGAILIGSAVIVFFLIIEAQQLITALFSPSETDNAMKIALLSGYERIFSKPLWLFFGQGYNAQTWSNTLQGMVNSSIGATKTELTFLEIIRTYGLLVGGPFIALLIWLGATLKKAPQSQQWLFVGFAFYLLDSATNAYLFSSNGMLPLALVAASASYYSRSAR